jgi:hypothetical protein
MGREPRRFFGKQISQPSSVHEGVETITWEFDPRCSGSAGHATLPHRQLPRPHVPRHLSTPAAKSGGLPEGVVPAKNNAFLYAGDRPEWHYECNKQRSLIVDHHISP